MPAGVHVYLDRARQGIAVAAAATTAEDRYAEAHVAALRIAAAVLAARSRPSKQRPRGQRNAWILLANAAPDLDEWAAFFAAGAAKRAAAESRLPGSVTAQEAADLLREVKRFLAVVESYLGLEHQALFDDGLEATDLAHAS